jgi:hypothetical protein
MEPSEGEEMIVVKFEMWPGGNEENKYPLGAVFITNDGSGTGDKGNYNFHITHTGKHINKSAKGKFWKKGHIHGFPRKLGVYHLLARCFQEVNIK